jgi:hypothetical protein
MVCQFLRLLVKSNRIPLCEIINASGIHIMSALPISQTAMKMKWDNIGKSKDCNLAKVFYGWSGALILKIFWVI